LVRGLAKLKPFQGRWVGLAAAAALAERFSNGEPVTSHDALADRLRLPPGPLGSVLEPLVEARLLALAEGRGRAYLLARPPHDITLDQILAAYDRASLPAFNPLGGEMRAHIGDLFGKVNQLRKQGLAGATLADLVEEVEGTVEL
jgi:DNA-binding IscR family transcriptional regulator